MTSRGFTLLELLLAMVITLLIVGAAVAVTASARVSFLVEPATLDTVRRLREGADVLAAALAGAGGDQSVGDGVWSLRSSVPPIRPLSALDESPADGFTAVWVLRAIPGGMGRVLLPQDGPSGSLTLDRVTSGCPLTSGVCGFTVDDVAAVFDRRGHVDLFQVGAVSAPLARVTPRAPLARAYGPGAWVVGVRADRFGLVRQADGSHTLTRVTWAGAREPMVDGVVDLDVRVWGRAEVPELRDAADGPGLAGYGLHPPAADEVDIEGVFPDGEHCMAVRAGGVPQSRLQARARAAGDLVEFAPADFADGPWCPGDGWPGAFDADLFRVQRIDLRLRVEVQSAEFRGPAGPLFSRGGAASARAPRWIRDRTIHISVAVGAR